MKFDVKKRDAPPAKIARCRRSAISCFFGTSCLNVGCIPTKCLLHSAELVSQIKEQGKDIGVEVEGVHVNFPQVIAHIVVGVLLNKHEVITVTSEMVH